MKLQTKGGRLQELDALRGVAAMGVVLFHFTMNSVEPYAKFLRVGSTGVDLFFIISGFVIFMSINKVREGREFVVSRFSRLFPTYWACVTFTFLLQTALSLFYFHKDFTGHDAAQYGTNMTMLQYFFGFEHIDGSYWTLTIELIFYVFIFALLQLKQLDRIEGISFAMVVGLGLLQNLPIPAVRDFYASLIKAVPICDYFPLFLAGIVFYKIFSEKPTAFRYFIIASCFAAQVLNSDGRLYYITFAQYLTALILYFGLFILFVNNKLSFIVSKWSVFLGTISYALYLVHQVFSNAFLLPLLHSRLHINVFVSYAISLAAVILLATFITFYIEKPLGKKIKTVMKKLLRVQSVQPKALPREEVHV